MPEGPEVRRHADALAAALNGERIRSVTARTRSARAWLELHGEELRGRRVCQVRSRGKHIVGTIEGGYYFHCHLMMWGRWRITEPGEPVERRERARIGTDACDAILTSAPVFNVGAGDPAAHLPHLRDLGPDILPYADAAPFDTEAFEARIRQRDLGRFTIGAALLDQTIAAGIGNYLRCEILYDCAIDPWKKVGRLTAAELSRLSASIPLLARRAYEHEGTTVAPADKLRLRDDASLVYSPGREYGTRHYVFRRTNLPCLRCGDIVRQVRQVTRLDQDGEHSRITYFCPACQAASPLQRKPADSTHRPEAAAGSAPRPARRAIR